MEAKDDKIKAGEESFSSPGKKGVARRYSNDIGGEN